MWEIDWPNAALVFLCFFFSCIGVFEHAQSTGVLMGWAGPAQAQRHWTGLGPLGYGFRPVDWVWT